jgi:hypothetical protein
LQKLQNSTTQKLLRWTLRRVISERVENESGTEQSAPSPFKKAPSPFKKAPITYFFPASSQRSLVMRR